MNSGIYSITNKINNKIYIGKTKNFKRRFGQYKYDYEHQRGDQINSYLLASMNKYGFENFEFKVVEYCDIENCAERELFWMDEFQSLNRDKGYNLRADSSSGMITHSTTSKKISDRLKLEWKSGVRSSHSQKLSKNISKKGEDYLKSLSEHFSKALTKYLYVIHDKSKTTVVKYKELKELKLHSVLSKFARSKCDKVEFKGLIIERIIEK